MSNTLSAEMLCESDHRIDAPENRKTMANTGWVNAGASENSPSAGLITRRGPGSAGEDRKADRQSGELGDTPGVFGGEDH